MSANPTRQLAPWEEIIYFNDPVWTLVATNSTSWTPLVAANPQRVCIVFQGNTGQTFICTDPTQGGVAGISVSLTLPQVVFTQADHATLCTAAWFGRGTTNVKVSIGEVILRQMPECQP